MITQDIYELVRQIGKILDERKLKLVTVESCTGGMLAAALTAVPGSSTYFERGFVTYSNESKAEAVGVSTAILEKYGAVSLEVATAMVEGGIKHSHAQIGMAITGIAGPSGGTPDKPVGTVCFAWKILNQPATVIKKVFSGDRHEVRQQATQFALQQLLRLFE